MWKFLNICLTVIAALMLNAEQIMPLEILGDDKRSDPETLSVEFESALFPVAEFDWGVLSWTAETGAAGSVELSVRVYSNDGVSQYFSYGVWSANPELRQGAKAQSDAFAELDIDVLTAKVPITAIQYKAVLSRQSVKQQLPVLRQLTWSSGYKDAMDKRPEIFAVPAHKVEVIRQGEVPEIGAVVCSPTSLTMILNYFGAPVTVMEMPEKVFDPEHKIYGNWSYNVAAAGELGFDGYVGIFKTAADLAVELTKGPIAVSLAGVPSGYQPDADDTDTILASHIVLLTGIEQTADGRWWVNIIDPAESTPEKCIKRYRVPRFEAAWSHAAYVVRPVAAKRESR